MIIRRHWCAVLEVPFGESREGKVIDADTIQLLKIKHTGNLAMAFLYRSDGAYSDSSALAKLLAPGEKLWTGRVYSNPVFLNVRKLRQP